MLCFGTCAITCGQVCSTVLISPELLTVLEEEVTRDLHCLDFFQNRCYYFYTFIPHLEIEYIASVSEARGKICKQVTGEETVWHWNVLNLSFCCSKMEDRFRFWSAKSQTNPLFTKQEASLFITLLNQEEATVMKKLLSLTNKEHFNRLTSTIL